MYFSKTNENRGSENDPLLDILVISRAYPEPFVLDLYQQHEAFTGILLCFTSKKAVAGRQL